VFFFFNVRQSSPLRITLGGLLLLLVLGAGAAWADHQSLYVLGLKAVDRELWADGVILFSKAIFERPEAGGLVRPYGTWTESYIPHYYLGLCLYHLGRYADALDAWQRFDDQPPSSYPRNRPRRKTVEELRRTIATRLPEEMERLRSEVAAALRLLGELEDAALLIERGGETSKTDLEIVAELLKEASRALSGSSERLDLAEVLRGVRPLIDRANEKLAEQSSQAERLRRQDVIARELEARRARRVRYEEAVGHLADGECSPRAIDLLLDIVHRSALDASDLGDEAEPALRLATAHLLCGSTDRAAQYLEMARQDISERPETAELVDRVADALGEAAQPGARVDPGEVATAMKLYFEASSWIELGECRTDVAELLDEAERSLVVESDGERRLSGILPPLDYTPFLAKARASWNCRDRPAAEASLEQARRLGVASASEIEALELRLEQTPMGGLYGSSHALVVIAHDYDHDDAGWDDLPGARDDVEAIRHALATHGFSVEVLENPPSEVLERRIKKFIARYGRDPLNRIVIYWAGHGWTEEAMGIKRGYVVPVDSPHPERTDESFEYLISMGTFEMHSRPMLARHALFIFDTCFGGMVFEGGLGEIQSPADTGDPSGSARRLAPAELLKNPVRMFLSAGDETQSVPDFSVFRRTVVRGLNGEADGDGDELVLGHELGRFVRNGVADASYTTPQWGVMSGGDLGRGDIAFQSLGIADETAAQRLETEIKYWSTVWGSAESQRYRDYLELYPDGAFARLAAWRLGELGNDPPGSPH
jgi:tetratricopeptide (TPR) repeat protein